MSNVRVTKKGQNQRRLTLPYGVNENEARMFIAFAKSVNQNLFKA